MVVHMSGGPVATMPVVDPNDNDLSIDKTVQTDDDLSAGETVAQNFDESGSVKVAGKTVTDNEQGVSVEGPADTTKPGGPTSIYEADREDLTASGTGTEADVEEFVRTRDTGGSGGGETNASAPSTGDDAGLGALTSGLDLGDTTTQAAIALVALAALWGVSR